MTTETPDYVLAQNECAALFASFALKSETSAPIADVKDNWPCILYHCTFSKGSRNAGIQYRLGVGHVKWPTRFEEIPKGADIPVFNTILNNPNAQLKNKTDHAVAAALLAKVQKVSPKPSEVLASICRDSLEAHQNSFAVYADNLGLNADSIKDKAIYDYCLEMYHKLTGLIGADNVTKMAELGNRF